MSGRDRQRRPFTRRASRSALSGGAGRLVASSGRATVEPLEARQLLFSLNILDDGATQSAFFAYTIPTLFPNKNGVPVAFYAVVSIAVIGLYIAYVIPTYQRWRMGDDFVPGPWTLGNKYKWMNPIAVIWTAIITIIFILPTVPAGVPWNDEFDWNAVNYAPIVTGGVFLAVLIWWLAGAKNTFTGPRHTIAEIDEELGGIDPDDPHPGGVSP